MDKKPCSLIKNYSKYIKSENFHFNSKEKDKADTANLKQNTNSDQITSCRHIYMIHPPLVGFC